MKRNKQELENLIKKAKYAYYNTDTPIMTDIEYDLLIKEYGEELDVGAPVLDSISKTEIKDRPMLSLDKVHTTSEIELFQNKKDIIASIKCDGLSVRLIYEDGQLIEANTRGNGYIGGNIFTHVHYINDIPKNIPVKQKLIIDGEVIIYKKDFNEKFKNQRNAAAGGLNLLNMKEVQERHLSFIMWDMFLDNCKYYHEKLQKGLEYGFKVVYWEPVLNINNSIDHCIEQAKEQGCPYDGVVFKIDDIEYGDTLGSTSHHFKNAVAWKPEIELYETEVKDIEWTMGRTGQLTPVLIYNDVDINGTTCNRASLHNITIMTKLMGGAFPGQRVFIYKSNEIIPQVANAQTNNPNNVPLIEIPKVCPYCGKPTEIRKDNDSKILYCTNINCDGRLINRLDHFAGKKGLDIKGLSKATLEKLINKGWVNSISDLFKLHSHQSEWMKMAGFGIASVNKILNAIEEAKNCTFDKYLCALGIPLIGKVASKTLANVFGDYKTFRKAIEENDERLYKIDGIGEVMINTLLNYDYTESDEIFDKYINETAAACSTNSAELEGKTFCITGKLKTYKNRDELKSFIESRGGKVTGSVTSKTSYLINNDVNSESSKNVTAKKLNVPIISEEDLVLMLAT